MTAQRSSKRVYMMDLLATVPYYTAYLSRALEGRGVDVQVGSMTYYLDRGAFKDRGLRLDTGLLDIVGHFASLPASIRRSAKLLEACINLALLSIRWMVRQPAVLHVQYLALLRYPMPLDLLLVRAARWRGARVVVTVHDVLPHDSGVRYRSRFARLYASADRLICHSEHVSARLQQEFDIPERLIHVIPHGPFFYDFPVRDHVALTPDEPASSQEKIVLCQGIIMPYKGVDVLLRAWKDIECQLETCTLIVAGTGSPALLQSLRRQAESLQLERVIFDFRFVSPGELVSMYRKASVAVYPYRAITTSGALATGLSLGKAIVASDLPVFQELLSEGEAILVPPGEPSQLADALLSVLTDHQLRNDLTEAVLRKDFGSASWQHIATLTEAVYDEVLQP